MIHQIMTEQQIIFFCGPDRCGKTQIASALSDRIGVPYFKASSEHRSFLSRDEKETLFLNQLHHADPRVLDLLSQTGHSVIFDRGFPCEWVYSQVFDRKTDVEFLSYMDEMWSKAGAKIVFCYRSSYEGIVDDIDPSINHAKLERIDSLYRRYLTDVTKCQHLMLNVDDEDLDREVSDVIKFIFNWSSSK
jgi:deoxyadenosine/deoxycytidine kinase